MTADALAAELVALAVSGSVRAGADPERRGFAVEAEAEPARIEAVAALMRGSGYFLECLSAVDREDFRELWYQFNRFDRPARHLVRVGLDATDSVPSISHIFGSARWFEREAFDMMGIQVQGHPNLKRLLLPEDADFHPLRRDQCIDDDLKETREKRRAKRIAQAEKEAEKARAAAEAEAALAAEGEAGSAPAAEEEAGPDPAAEGEAGPDPSSTADDGEAPE